MDFVHTWGSFGWGELPWGSSLYESDVNESAVALDAIATQGSFGISVQEAAVATDAVNAAAVFNSATQDSAVSADTVLAATTFISALVESVSGQETVSAKFLPSCLIREFVAIQDEVLGGSDFSVHIEESAVAEDVLTFSNSTYNIGVFEDVTAQDASSTNTVLKSTVTASVTASDSPSRRLLWEPINTGVDEDWTLINTNS